MLVENLVLNIDNERYVSAKNIILYGVVDFVLSKLLDKVEQEEKHVRINDRR